MCSRYWILNPDLDVSARSPSIINVVAVSLVAMDSLDGLTVTVFPRRLAGGSVSPRCRYRASVEAFYLA
jgi:hypothetical protein